MAWGLGVGVAVAGWRADLSLPRNNRVVALVVVGRGGCIIVRVRVSRKGIVL